MYYFAHYFAPSIIFAVVQNVILIQVFLCFLTFFMTTKTYPHTKTYLICSTGDHTSYSHPNSRHVATSITFATFTKNTIIDFFLFFLVSTRDALVILTTPTTHHDHTPLVHTSGSHHVATSITFATFTKNTIIDLLFLFFLVSTRDGFVILTVQTPLPRSHTSTTLLVHTMLQQVLLLQLLQKTQSLICFFCFSGFHT